MRFNSYALTAFAAVLSSSSSAAPTILDTILHAPSIIPSVFQNLGSADATTPFTMTLQLNGANLAGLAAKMEADAASLPAPMSIEEVAVFASPSAADLTTVQNYLKSQGFTDAQMTYSAFNDQITVPTTVGQAAKMFAATFDSYSFGGLTMPRTTAYTIPAVIANQVSLVSPIASFVDVKTSPIKKTVTPAKKRELWQDLDSRAVPAGCDTTGVTPACLRNLYQTSTYVPTATTANSVFIAGFIGQSVDQLDLQNFLKTYRPDIPSGYQIPIINTAGAINLPLVPGVEAMLDVETVTSATYPLKATFYNYGNQLTQGDIFGAAFNDIINNYKTYNSPGVYSVSYGSDENSITQAEANAMCNSAMKLSALGTTIVISSGDNGVGGTSGDTCPPFVPTYPSGCQYVLSVGATQNFSPEVAVDPTLAGFYSGAGFSNLFPQPSYQKAAVAAYRKQIGTLDVGDYNTTGRAYPDVSAQGSLYIIDAMLMSETVSGTSCSAPTTASVIALLNDARRKKNLGNVGWFNPFVYANTGDFTDITSGSSMGCGSTTLGFPVKSSWDPSTGVGSPLFSKLRATMGV
ncbi:hypothetical protein CBS101457_003920 [Exobasidium rhododendri]|nr:hypothetical protein CBS101457_003920 [Exobasidium rhododendri]